MYLISIAIKSKALSKERKAPSIERKVPGVGDDVFPLN